MYHFFVFLNVFMNNIHYLCNTNKKVEFKGPKLMTYKGLNPDPNNHPK
jgi:hypothetical protein